MTVLWWPAIISGWAGALAMGSLVTLLRRAGWTRMSWGSLLGIALLPPDHPAARWGLTLHFIDGAVAGVLYALAFQLFDIETSAFWVGLLFGIVHGGIGLLAFDLLRRRWALDPVQLAEQDRGRLAIALGFVVFGITDALVYRSFVGTAIADEPSILWIGGVIVLGAWIMDWIGRRERAPTFTGASPEEEADHPKQGGG